MGIFDKEMNQWINHAFGSYCPTCKAPNSLKYNWKASWKHMFSCKHWVVCTSCGAEFACGFKRNLKAWKEVYKENFKQSRDEVKVATREFRNATREFRDGLKEIFKQFRDEVKVATREFRDGLKEIGRELRVEEFKRKHKLKEETEKETQVATITSGEAVGDTGIAIVQKELSTAIGGTYKNRIVAALAGALVGAVKGLCVSIFATIVLVICIVFGLIIGWILWPVGVLVYAIAFAPLYIIFIIFEWLGITSWTQESILMLIYGGSALIGAIIGGLAGVSGRKHPEINKLANTIDYGIEKITEFRQKGVNDETLEECFVGLYSSVYSTLIASLYSTFEGSLRRGKLTKEEFRQVTELLDRWQKRTTSGNAHLTKEDYEEFMGDVKKFDEKYPKFFADGITMSNFIKGFEEALKVNELIKKIDMCKKGK